MNVQIDAWHSLSVEEALDKMGGQLSGLAGQEAAARLIKFGANEIPQPKPDSLFKLLCRQLNSPIVWVLLGSGLLAFILKRPADAYVILLVVLINTLIGFIQEYKATRAVASLSSFVPLMTRAFRDRQLVSIPASSLVAGDVIFVEAGDQLPADMRLLEGSNLYVQESTLTGEAFPIEKCPKALAKNLLLADRKNMLYAGTFVTTGAGKCLVIATGRSTEIGKMSMQLEQSTNLDTPLTLSLKRMTQWISLWVLSLTAIIAVVALLRGFPFVDAMIAAVALAVAAIPEGLPAIVTIVLAIAVRKMAQKKAIIRYLPAVETLGSTSVICTDKTGTLTQNQMTVKGIWLQDKQYQVSGSGYQNEGSINLSSEIKQESFPELQEMITCGFLCNDASIQWNANGSYKMSGDPTDVALIVLSEKYQRSYQKIIAKPLNDIWKRLSSLPFDSATKYMEVRALNHQTGGIVSFLKGAPEVIKFYCSLSSSESSKIELVLNQFAAEGMRVLAFAQKVSDNADSTVSTLPQAGTYQFLGLVGISDPLRDDVVKAVQTCHKAGIRVKMITGDHIETARMIGKQLGLSGLGLQGIDIENMSQIDLQKQAEEHDVFARVTPEHKLRIVQALQSNGRVVAMTGDGVNDAPALKKADIGVSMGLGGTAVARDASAIILADDNFATLQIAVLEGRVVYQNIVKSLSFILPTSLAQGLIVAIAVTFLPIIDGHPLMPLSPVQILWVNLITAVSLSLPFAFEPGHSEVMSSPPIRPKQPLISGRLFLRSILVGVFMALASIGLFLWEYRHVIVELKGSDPLALREAQTIAVTFLVVAQIIYFLISRQSNGWNVLKIFKENLWAVVGVVFVFILQYLFIYNPFAQSVFQTEALDNFSLIKIAGMSLVIFALLVVEEGIAWYFNPLIHWGLKTSVSGTLLILVGLGISILFPSDLKQIFVLLTLGMFQIFFGLLAHAGARWVKVPVVILCTIGIVDSLYMQIIQTEVGLFDRIAVILLLLLITVINLLPIFSVFRSKNLNEVKTIDV